MALAWLFERQLPSDSERASRLLAACGEVPQPRAEGDRFLARLNSLPFFTESDPLPDRASRILGLAREHGLSSYDASYLELAQRLGAALASFDRQLNRAAGAIGVALVSGK